MNIGFVLGNGISRKSVNIEALRLVGKIYGCNALYREFTPDVLVATDRPIAMQIQESGYALKNRFYTRKPLEGTGALKVLHDYYGYSSGPNAVAIAANDKNQQIYMIGFDMGPTLDNKFNNVYAGTDFYKTPDALPTFTGNWVKQLVKITADYPTTQFIRICGETTARIPELDAIKNMQHQDITRFLDRINNKKDL